MAESTDKTGQTRKTPLGIEKRFDRFGDWLEGSWALRKAIPIFDRYPQVVKILSWTMRLLVGATFTVSGLVKAIDPWGTYYKLKEYITAMHLPLSEWGNIVLTLSFFLFSMEFIIGLSIVTGCFRKASPIWAALFMVVMLPLTFWIAIADPVADCGCFGDFLTLSNWTTFFKNVVLSLAIVWLLKFNCEIPCLISPYFQWLAVVGMSAYILFVGMIGYCQQPMVDFRQYKIGTQLLAPDDKPEYEPVFIFVYEKNGVEKIFGEDDDLPSEDDGWTFVRREEKEFVNNNKTVSESYSMIPDFRIWNEDSSEDVTEVLAGEGNQLIIFTPDIKNLSMATSWKINRLYDIANEVGVDFFAVVSGSPEDIRQWRDRSSGQYPIYTAEDTSIKELVRGNPAIVYLESGRIAWKTALSALEISDEDVLPDEEVVPGSKIENESRASLKTWPIGTGMTGHQALECLSIILIGFLSLIALATKLHSAKNRH